MINPSTPSQAPSPLVQSLVNEAIGQAQAVGRNLSESEIQNVSQTLASVEAAQAPGGMGVGLRPLAEASASDRAHLLLSIGDASAAPLGFATRLQILNVVNSVKDFTTDEDRQNMTQNTEIFFTKLSPEATDKFIQGFEALTDVYERFDLLNQINDAGQRLAGQNAVAVQAQPEPTASPFELPANSSLQPSQFGQPSDFGGGAGMANTMMDTAMTGAATQPMASDYGFDIANDQSTLAQTAKTVQAFDGPDLLGMGTAQFRVIMLNNLRQQRGELLDSCGDVIPRQAAFSGKTDLLFALLGSTKPSDAELSATYSLAGDITLLHEAIMGGQTQTANQILCQFSSPDARAALLQKQTTAPVWLGPESNRVQVNAGATALHIAATQGDMNSVKFLLAEGIDASALDQEGMSAADAAQALKNEPMAGFLETFAETKMALELSLEEGEILSPRAIGGLIHDSLAEVSVSVGAPVPELLWSDPTQQRISPQLRSVGGHIPSRPPSSFEPIPWLAPEHVAVAWRGFRTDVESSFRSALDMTECMHQGRGVLATDERLGLATMSGALDEYASLGGLESLRGLGGAKSKPANFVVYAGSSHFFGVSIEKSKTEANTYKIRATDVNHSKTTNDFMVRLEGALKESEFLGEHANIVIDTSPNELFTHNYGSASCGYVTMLTHLLDEYCGAGSGLKDRAMGALSNAYHAGSQGNDDTFPKLTRATIARFNFVQTLVDPAQRQKVANAAGLDLIFHLTSPTNPEKIPPTKDFLLSKDLDSEVKASIVASDLSNPPHYVSERMRAAL